MDIILPNDCENAPKRRIIKNFIVSLYQKHWCELAVMLDEKFLLIPVGHSTITELEELKKFYSLIENIETLNIVDILSHGKFGACQGKLHFKNNSNMYFAYFFEFKSAATSTITQLTAYLITS